MEVGGDLNLELLLKTLNHGDLPEGRGEVDFELLTLRTLRVILDLVRAGDVEDQAREEALSDLHQIVVVGVGHVKLASGELGVVGEVNALIAELATDLVNTVKASNNEHLQRPTNHS